MNKDFFIAGIGASAGGYDALKAFFTGMPGEPGISFVIVQHLSRDYKSLTNEFIARHTAMKVQRVRNHETLRPNYIYVMPEDRMLEINDGHFETVKTGEEKVSLAIDIFFHSLAAHYREKAIGIVLSGTGTDGSRGIQSIKEKGGLVMVQEPASAGFDSMPAAAIASNHPDYVLPPEQLAGRLLQFIQSTEVIKEEAMEDAAAGNDKMIRDIIEQVSDFSRVNFKNYKTTTISRRIEKRVKINHLKNVAEYHQYTLNHPEELLVLYHDLLIGVTRFFRDTEAFQALYDTVIPQLCQSRPAYETLRLWVIASSTGEEAYSIAMLLDEYMRKHEIDLNYKVFATDVDNKALAVARAGRYGDNIEADVSPERLKKYFEKTGGIYEVKKALRKKVIFSRHNILGDPPFIRLDLIACRNLFIYLKEGVQKRLLRNFNYALKPEGWLFMGSSEVLASVDNLFKTVSGKHKIFQNTSPGKYRPQVTDPGSMSAPFHPLARFLKTSHSRVRPLERYADIIIDMSLPPCVLIDSSDAVVYTGGAVDRYLHLPRHRADLSLYRLAGEDLALLFRKGIRRIRERENAVLFKGMVILNDTAEYQVSIGFEAVRQSLTGNENGLILITFRDHRHKPETRPVMKNISQEAYSRPEVAALEKALKMTKKELQYTVAELETINGELQASNEEILSGNEELQSTNEELQSSNEELHAVNAELKDRIEEVTNLHNDLNNLFINTHVAIIFLDNQMNIRNFTPAARQYFNVGKNHIGRSLNSLNHDFGYDQFREDAGEVFKKMDPVEKEIRDNKGRYFMMRIVPYQTEEVRLEGIVITLVDITQLKKARVEEQKAVDSLKQRTLELEKSEQNYRSLVNSTPDMVARYDNEGRHLLVNKAMEEMTGFKESQLLKKKVTEVNSPGDPRQFHTMIKKVFEERNVLDYYFCSTTGSGTRHFYCKLIPEYGSENKAVSSVVSITRDISTLRQYEEKLLKSQRNLQSLVDNTPDVIARFNRDLVCTFMSPGARNLIGRKAGSGDGAFIRNLSFPCDVAEQLNGYIVKVFKTGQEVEKELQFTFNNVRRDVLVKVISEKPAGPGIPASVLVIITDVTLLKEKEAEIRAQKENLERSNEMLDNLIHTIAHDFRSPVSNMKMLATLMERSGSPEENEKFIEVLKKSVYQLDDKLAGLIKIVESQFNIQDIVEDLSFQEVLKDISEEIQLEQQGVHAKMTTDFKQGEVRYIKGYLRSIMQNLISNALKYRQKDKPLQIEVITERSGGFVLLSVKDNGIGIDLKKNRNHLFKPFKRFCDIQEGKGIGLHIVKTMVARNGGKILAESQPGNGTTFKVYLKEYGKET